MMKKIIFISIAIIVLAVFAFIGYYLYFKSSIYAKPSDKPMTKDVCKNGGDEWIEGHIMTDEGDISFNNCICRKILIPSKMSHWIAEGEMKKCP